MVGIFLTGASGFVGAGLLKRLVHDSFDCTIAVRSPLQGLPSCIGVKNVESFSADVDLQGVLAGNEVVIHCAGRAHINHHEDAADSLAEFRAVNVSCTLNLARQAVAAGVKRFIFISSIGVNGNQTSQPFTADDLPSPVEPYAVSKFEAEQELRLLAFETTMEVVIIRPPLVYGPNAPGNFARLLKIVSQGIPLPLGSIYNKRSLVALDNLVDLIVTCIDHPAAANQTFLVSDGEDLSTSELLGKIAIALGKPVRLLPLPSWILELGARLLSKQTLSQRLCGSLQVDISKTRELLGWSPPVSVDDALRQTAAQFLAQQQNSRR